MNQYKGRKRKDLLKLPRQLFKVHREYKTKSKVTKRTLAISEAFGLGIDETLKFPIFSNFEIELKTGHVLLITGESGSGKSTLLHEIEAQISARGAEEFPRGVISNSSVKIEDDEVLIEGVGEDVSQSISILSMAGLNEAFLMMRRYKELSDGQKYRFRLARMIDSKADVWAFDEFTSVLDRVTAKVVSYTLGKTARKLGKTVIIATTHEDLLLDLKPDIWIRKGFGDAVKVQMYQNASQEFPKGCTLLQDLKVMECKHEELKELEKFHYRGSSVGIVRKCFKAMIGDDLAAGIVYVYPHFALKGRNIAMPEYAGKSTFDKIKQINKDISRISRVVVHPKFRSIGLGSEIVRRTLPQAPTKIVETLAVMARYNPFFEHAGMTRVETPEDQRLTRALLNLEKETGLKRELLASKKTSMKVLRGLARSKIKVAQSFALNWCVAKKFRKTILVPKVRAFDREAIAEALSLLRGRTLYLYWSKKPMNLQLPAPKGRAPSIDIGT
jgi:ABC-type ATPase with predicted acetyltransferase domain